MKKYPLIGISIIAVVLLVLGSLSNVVGFQTVQLSNQKVVSGRITQKELLFQTIMDIANNKEIQRIILKYQICRGILPVSDIPVLAKNQLKQMYFIGLILSKVINKSKMQSIVDQYQFSNQEMQKEITTVIEKDATLDREVTQLVLNSGCDCQTEKMSSWHFPILCTILLSIFWILWYPCYIISVIFDRFGFPYPLFYFYLIITYYVCYFLGGMIGCWWFLPD